MQKLIFKCPLNNLSFGNVSYNLIREIWKRQDIDLTIFPYNNNIDLSSFAPIDRDLQKFLNHSIKNRYINLSRTTPCLNLWHLNGAENKISDKNILYTFHETGQSTQQEVNIANTYDACVFSSSYSKEHFSEAGVINTGFSPLGFDEDLHDTKKEYMTDKIHFGLMGKWENRKNTSKIIKYWLSLYGNNNDYQLTCCVNNSFLNKEQIASLKREATSGIDYFNINFLPWLDSNAQVNDYLNSIDIDLGGLSGAEGWNLPVFNSTCLGKWPIVLNSTSHKDWANEKNSILIEPNSKEPIYDDRFFKEGGEFNQGHMYTFTKEDFKNAVNKAIDKYNSKPYNVLGASLKKKYSYKNTLDTILNFI